MDQDLGSRGGGQELPPDPLIGRVLAERYRILSPLGKGGMGAVYRVEHVALKKEMALKILPEGMSDSDDAVRRFLREAEAAARLDHPNIIRVTDFGRSEEGLFFLAMELLSGHLLADLLEPDRSLPPKPLPPARATHIVTQIARALEHAHSVGVIHRDLKPQNIILVERDGEQDIVKLLDFGIAKILQPDGGAGEALTQAGMVYGTPEYLSPEQAVGDPIDPRADLYSLGVIFFEMLTGRLPFESKSKLEILHKHVHDRPPPLRSIAPSVSDDLGELIDRLLIKQREQRPGTATEVIEILGRADTSTAPAELPKNPVLRLGTQTMRGVFRYARRTKRRLQFGPRRERIRAVVPLVVMALGIGFGWMALSARASNGTPAALQRMTEPQQVAMVEALLGSGQLAAARAALQQVIADHPQSGRANFLYGHLNYVEGERLRAISDYRRAIELDPSLGDEPAMRANIRASLDRKAEAAAAIDLLSQALGPRGAEDLQTCAKSCRLESVRKRAQDALDRRETKEDPKDAKDRDTKDEAELSEELDNLKKGKTCAARKNAALAIIAAKDRRYLAPLKAARDRRGGFLGLESVNGCMQRELDEAIAALRSEK